MSYLITQDLASENICGIDYRYEEDYLNLEQEVDKAYSVTQDGPTNWELVVKNSEEILISKSKDIKLASWWLLGNWKLGIYSTFEEKLKIFVELLEKYSDELYPKSKKARFNTFFWLENNLIKDLNVFETNKNKITNPLVLLELFERLNSLINEITQKESSFFKKIINFLKPLAQEYEKSKESPVESSNNNVKSDPKKNNSVEELNEINDEKDAIKALRNLKNLSSMLSNYYRKNSFVDLKALRITRFLCWLDTQGLPNSENKKTFLPAPLEFEIDEILEFKKNEDYEKSFILIEEMLEVSPFWLDGHFYAYEILDKTGHKNEAEEIKNSLLSFIKTNEGILELKFNDGTAFASNKTKNWIEEDSFKEETQSTKENKPNTNEQKLEKIYEFANKDKLKEAMQLLEKEYLLSNTVEEKFNWRLNHAQLAIEFDKKDIALALLEELEKEITHYHLDEWNPKLASKVYSLLLTSFSSIDILPQKIEMFYKKLCKTDISNALEININ